jgi:hypothetical protein
MTRKQVVGCAVLILLSSVNESQAVTCAQKIAETQQQVDAAITATAASGRGAPESLDARLHRQPTPGSLAAAEMKLGGGQRNVAAAAALDEARAADREGRERVCESAVRDAKRALGVPGRCVRARSGESCDSSG